MSRYPLSFFYGSPHSGVYASTGNNVIIINSCENRSTWMRNYYHVYLKDQIYTPNFLCSYVVQQPILNFLKFKNLNLYWGTCSALQTLDRNYKTYNYQFILGGRRSGLVAEKGHSKYLYPKRHINRNCGNCYWIVTEFTWWEQLSHIFYWS